MPLVAVPKAKVRVFVDTNVILEAFRTGCWPALVASFSVETVEKCIEEALTGDPSDPRHVAVDPGVLAAGLAARHAVDKRILARFALEHPASAGLDDGELHLLAWLHAQGLLPKVLVLLSTADKAAIVATGRLGGLDSLVSLEQLGERRGCRSRPGGQPGSPLPQRLARRDQGESPIRNDPVARGQRWSIFA